MARICGERLVGKKNHKEKQSVENWMLQSFKPKQKPIPSQKCILLFFPWHTQTNKIVLKKAK